ncbi:tetrahydrofolate dehydrogenase/cyclohydrolase catalytic domain-containing protein [Clostridium perfringens]
MLGTEINTKEIVDKWINELKERSRRLYVTPNLTIVQIGDNEASNKYIKNKLSMADKLGIYARHLKFPETITQTELNMVMKHYGEFPIILQLPVPDHINVEQAMAQIDPKSDVDGFTHYQKALLLDGNMDALVPATALGIHRILKETVGDLTGKKVAIVNRSHLIGQPLLQLMLRENAIPTMLHSKVPHHKLLKELDRSEIVVTGCGKRKLFSSNCFTPGQVLIDCSMNRVDGIPGVGDMDKEEILKNIYVQIASGYGHTGMTTTVGLMENVIKVYEQQMQ